MAHILRSPCRKIVSDDQTIVAPCDGVVLEIKLDAFPDELGSDSMSSAKRITIQNRINETQLQTSPVTGHIVDNHLVPGLFTEWGDNSTSWQAARSCNERREIRFRDQFEREVILVQLASKTARQLVCRLAQGKFIKSGEPIGMARIAGVVDLYVPERCEVLIEAGQHTISGETALARFARRGAE